MPSLRHRRRPMRRSAEPVARQSADSCIWAAGPSNPAFITEVHARSASVTACSEVTALVAAELDDHRGQLFGRLQPPPSPEVAHGGPQSEKRHQCDGSREPITQVLRPEPHIPGPWPVEHAEPPHTSGNPGNQHQIVATAQAHSGPLRGWAGCRCRRRPFLLLCGFRRWGVEVAAHLPVIAVDVVGPVPCFVAPSQLVPACRVGLPRPRSVLALSGVVHGGGTVVAATTRRQTAHVGAPLSHRRLLPPRCRPLGLCLAALPRPRVCAPGAGFCWLFGMPTPPARRSGREGVASVRRSPGRRREPPCLTNRTNSADTKN